MARKRIGYVELEWTCPSCGNENPGPRKFCNGCGAPQPADVSFHQAAQEILLTNEDEIARAEAGADVHCAYCNARNPAGATFCGACGADLSQAEARSSGQILGAFRKDPARSLTCPACSTLNLPGAKECAGCGASLAGAAEKAGLEKKPAAQAASSARRAGGVPRWLVFVIGAACLGAAVFVFSLLTKSEEMIGTVSGVAWTYSQSIEGMAPVESEAWLDEIPAGADVGACRQELRETVDEPVQGAMEVCGTPYTVDTGSGYGEVVQDCVYEVYDDRCTYTQLAWVVVDTATLSGQDLNPRWPSPTITSDQRLGEQEADYSVTFDTGEKTYTYQPSDEASFLTFQPGSSWLLEVNGLGAIVAVEPAP
jgi:ribosomal protein L40E